MTPEMMERALARSEAMPACSRCCGAAVSVLFPEMAICVGCVLEEGALGVMDREMDLARSARTENKNCPAPASPDGEQTGPAPAFRTRNLSG